MPNLENKINEKQEFVELLRKKAISILEVFGEEHQDESGYYRDISSDKLQITLSQQLDEEGASVTYVGPTKSHPQEMWYLDFDRLCKDKPFQNRYSLQTIKELSEMIDALDNELNEELLKNNKI